MTFAELMTMFVEHCRSQNVKSLPDFGSEEWHLLLWKIKQNYPKFAVIIGEFDTESQGTPMNINLINAAPALQGWYKPNIENRIVLERSPGHKRNLYVGKSKIYQELCQAMWCYLFNK